LLLGRHRDAVAIFQEGLLRAISGIDTDPRRLP